MALCIYSRHCTSSLRFETGVFPSCSSEAGTATYARSAVATHRGARHPSGTPPNHIWPHDSAIPMVHYVHADMRRGFLVTPAAPRCQLATQPITVMACTLPLPPNAEHHLRQKPLEARTIDTYTVEPTHCQQQPQRISEDLGRPLPDHPTALNAD